MKNFRIAKCLNKSGEIAEYAIFADGSRRKPIQTDETYGQYFEVDNELNKEAQTLRRQSYIGRIKDAVDMIKNGNGDCIKSTHIFGSEIIKVVYFVDRKVGDELRQKTLDGWKDTEFGYGIEYGYKGGLGGYSLINTQLESISAFSKNKKPMVFDSKNNAEAYVLSIIEKAKAYAKDMVTGFIRLNGMTVGAVANRSKVYDEEGNTAEEFDGTLSAMGCKKAAAFVKFCDAFGIPVLTLTNVKGLKATACSEKNLAREMAALTYAFADATVPKVNVITGKAFGSAYVTMNSKAIGADMVYAWPEAEIGMMAADMAAKIMYTDADADTLKAKTEEYKALQSSPLSAAGRGYVDTIIEPADTRKYVIGAFEMLFTKREERPSKKHGTI